MPARRAKHWCFTLNNPTDDECNALQALGEELREPLVYLILGKEKGQEGTPHIQGYCAFEPKQLFSYVKEFIGARAHIEPAKGTPKQNKAYCSKEGNSVEFGKLPIGQGRRSDLVAVAEKCKKGLSMRSIAEEHPDAVLRYGTGILRLKSYFAPPRSGPPEIWVLWGPTGVGKTRRVWEFADVDQLWVHPGDRWFDGYDGHHAVLFDDFDGGWFKLHYLLRLLDRYPMQVPIKGAYTQWSPRTIYITSNLEPGSWYPNAAEEHKRALLRRLNEFGSIQHCIRQ